jgi:hypothetical protein
VDKVDFAGPADVDSMGVLVFTGTNLTTSSLVGGGLLGIEVDSNTGFVPVEFLSRPNLVRRSSTIAECKVDLPSKLVTIIDPHGSRLADGGLDSLGVPDLLDEDTLGIIGAFTPSNLERDKYHSVRFKEAAELTSYW